MPSNHILINNALEYSVPDRNMYELIKWLGVNGYKADTGLKKEPEEIITKDKCIPAGAYKH
jgi:hypothetical protein